MGSKALILPPEVIGTSIDPTIVLGCSPFVAARQFGPKSEVYRKRFGQNPKAIADVWTAFVKAGGRALHLVDDEELCRAFEAWRPAWPSVEVWLTVASDDVDERCRWLAFWKGTRVFRHARQVDGGENLVSFLEASETHGLKPGVVTHFPGRLTVPGSLLDNLSLSLMTPFNATAEFMDIDPESLYARLRGRQELVAAMMTLAAGHIPWRTGASFAAMHFRTQVIGSGDPSHAASLARIGVVLDTVRSGSRFVRCGHSHVDVSDTGSEVVVMHDHRGLRISGAAAETWSYLSSPRTLEELVAWGMEMSCLPLYKVLPEMVGFLTILVEWKIVTPEPLS